MKNTIMNLGKICVKNPIKTNAIVTVSSAIVGTALGTAYHYISKKNKSEDSIDHKEFLEKIVESFDK